jgi:hypothetical protein
VEVKEGESIGVLRRVRWRSNDLAMGEYTSWSLVVNWAEIVDGNIRIDARREMALWKDNGIMTDLPI